MSLIRIAVCSADTFDLLQAVFLCIHDALERAEISEEFLCQGFDVFSEGWHMIRAVPRPHSRGTQQRLIRKISSSGVDDDLYSEAYRKIYSRQFLFFHLSGESAQIGLDEIPVDQLLNKCRQIVRPPVLVIKIICMFPDIDGEQGF